MFEQSRRLSEPLRWGRREKTAVAVVVSCLVLALVAAGVYALTSSSSHARVDCIEVTFASTDGAAQFHACGTRAREICSAPAGYHGIEAELRLACRRAGFPFGARS